MAFSDDERNALNKDLRLFSLLDSSFTGADLLEDLQTQIDNSPLGSEAASYDIDTAAAASILASENSSGSSGLNFAWHAGKVRFGRTRVTVSAGTLALIASTTNYVEVDSSGTVSRNNSAFSDDRIPLFTVTTSGAAITAVTPVRYPLVGFADGGVDGEMLSEAAHTKEISLAVGTIGTGAGSTKFSVSVPSTISTGRVTKVTLVSGASLATDNTNYVKVGIVNKGAAGSGTAPIADIAAASNSTQTTGGAALAANVKRNLVLATLSIGTERDVADDEVLEVTITAVGTLAGALTGVTVVIEIAFDN